MSRPPPPAGPPEERHLSEDHLEAFAMGKSLGMYAERVHAHLLACDSCCLRLLREAEFISALRQALREFKD